MFCYFCFVSRTYFIILRYRKHHTDEKPVRHNNPDAVQLEERLSLVDPIYSEIPDQSTPNYENSNAAGGSTNTDYQRLNWI